MCVCVWTERQSDKEIYRQTRQRQMHAQLATSQTDRQADTGRDRNREKAEKDGG